MHAGESLWNLYALVTCLERRHGTDPALLKALAGARNDLKVIGDLIQVPPPTDEELGPRIPRLEKPVGAHTEKSVTSQKRNGSFTANGTRALELGRDILIDMEDMPDKAAEFVESVTAKVKSMLEHVEKYGNASDKMVTALENMRYGQLRWLNRE